MARCALCGQEEALPFRCNYCGESFCGNHRLPETHFCPNRWMAVSPSQKREQEQAQARPGRGIRSLAFTKARERGYIEALHLLAAWATLTLAFALRLSLGSLSARALPLTLLAVGLGVGLGVVLHELGHKWAAQALGHAAEFRVFPLGLVLTLLTLGFFAAPGATSVLAATRKEQGLIAMAGPGANLVLSGLFALFLQLAGYVALLGLSMNLWLASFNLIPLGPLDGQKVFGWSRGVWGAISALSWTLTAMNFLGLI